MSTRFLLARPINLKIGDRPKTTRDVSGFEFGCDKCHAEPASFMLFSIAGEDHFHVACRNCGESICLRDAAAIIPKGRSPITNAH